MGVSGLFTSAHSNMKNPEQPLAEWDKIQRQAASSMSRRQFAAATQLLTNYLATTESPRTRSEALAFLGSVLEEQSDLEGAIQATLKAHAIASEADYHRYTLELTLGRLFRLLQAPDEALAWYWRALQTAAQDPITSGAAALKSYLQLKGGAELDLEEQLLLRRVISQAWTLFGLLGKPDLTNFVAAADILLMAGNRPRVT